MTVKSVEHVICVDLKRQLYWKSGLSPLLNQVKQVQIS